MKPGYQSTEFWLSLAATLLGALMASGAISSASPWAKIVGVAASLFASMGYTVGRTWLKGLPQGAEPAPVVAEPPKEA